MIKEVKRTGGEDAEEQDGRDCKVQTDLITLTRHVLYEQRKHSSAHGDMTLLLVSIQLGCKFVASQVRRAGLAHLTGLAKGVGLNVQGEQVKKLDVIANEIFINSLRTSGRVAMMVSEECDDVIVVGAEGGGDGDPHLWPNHGRHYYVVFDPLDGSSNIDCGVSVGTIFGVYHVKDNESLGNVLRPGSEMVAAGYALYGSFTTLVLSTGNGVNGYTLDPSLGEFILTHPKLSIPDKGAIYSINEGNTKHWLPPTRSYVDSVKQQSYSARYVGSMVADVHRTLLYGGTFMYPADKKSPRGKLRMLYECFPMAFIVEQAGDWRSSVAGRAGGSWTASRTPSTPAPALCWAVGTMCWSTKKLWTD